MKLSVIVGLVLATIYAGFSTVVYLADGGRASSTEDLSLVAVVATYYVAGVVGGIVVGALLPLAKSFLGAVAIGLSGAFVAVFCIIVATSGPFWRWDADTVQKLLVMSCAFGVVGTIVVLRNR